MSYRPSKIISSASAASIMLAGTMIAHADSMSPYSMTNNQTQQVFQEQEQTQFRNRQRLENRINGNDYGDMVQQRNRHQYREQRHNGGQTMGQTHNRKGGTEAKPSGHRMAGGAGRGRR